MENTKQWIGALIVFLLALSGCTNNRGVVERPAFIAKSNSAIGLEIEKIELSDAATMLYMKAFYPYGSWFKIVSNSFLTDNLGNQYPIQSTEGITMDEEFYMLESGEIEFTMIFPPVASNAVFVDFIENLDESLGPFKIWGIQLTNKPIKVTLPKGFKGVTVDKNAVLPPVEFKAGKARLEGQILNYRLGIPEEVSVRVWYPLNNRFTEIILSVDEKGMFSGEIDAFSVHPVEVYFGSNKTLCFIASDETTSIILNPAEMSRRASRLLGDKPSLGEPVYYSGYLASLSKELNEVEPHFSLQYYYDYESSISFFQNTVGTKTPEMLRNLFLDDRQAKKAMVDTLNASPACKQILYCSTDLFYASWILCTTEWIDIAYLYYNNQLQHDAETISKYYATRKFDLPDDFYDVLKDFPLLNVPQILYTRESMSLYGWKAPDRKLVLSKAIGTSQGILFDLMKVADIYDEIKDFKPVDEDQINQIPADFQQFIRMKNDELIQLIEVNKNKTEFTVDDVKQVADEDLFPFIISKFKGKPILLDFWETWCGPCRTANEELKPVKEELADKDIVYVYVASESSPLETWENMISDLSGEHFRLSEKQRSYLKRTFSIEGVPTYFFIDRQGNIKEKHIGYQGTQPMKEKLLKLLEE